MQIVIDTCFGAALLDVPHDAVQMQRDLVNQFHAVSVSSISILADGLSIALDTEFSLLKTLIIIEVSTNSF